ncbi:SGNH/GDSL hydrolase family protein [uncultured Microscilla sp.]|uniref:SGNH/GDSL hydrolase family protein n=1 Tax=uncultured Microscilla sp. TaxID=432653 RepID=UPI0026108597|nr:SGNH/GDSL hydrolase family protein [uncultured Microscilla sp.]
MKKLPWLLVLVISCVAYTKPVPCFGANKLMSAAPLKILFVGNSLTYTNDLPSILKYIMGKFGKSATMISLCKPNYALEDHWNEGKVQALIKKRGIQYVIVQQGPSSQKYGRQSLVEYGQKLKRICDEAGASLGFYMVWPAKWYYHTFDGVIANYSHAAQVNQALLFPVGVIWKAYQKRYKKVKLYGTDNFHPSRAGSFLAALTIFHKLHPSKNLQHIKIKDYKQWIDNRASFNTMVKLVVDLE